MHGSFDELKNAMLTLRVHQTILVAAQDCSILVTNVPDQNSHAPIDFSVICIARFPKNESERLKTIMRTSNITHVMALIIGLLCQESEGFSDRLEPVVWGEVNANG